MEAELYRVLQLLQELSEANSQNQKLAGAITSHTGVLKNQASHAVPPYTLRRFNVDLAKEQFDSELERTNAQHIIENQTLLYENKQLSVLLKEHETTMETIMSKFWNHAHAARQHEYILTRHYEALLMSRDSQTLTTDTLTSAAMSRAVNRLSHHLRNLLLAMEGAQPIEDPSFPPEMLMNFEYDPGPIDMEELETLFETLQNQEPASMDWADEREEEIARLQTENDQLRRSLGIDQQNMDAIGVDVDAELMRILPPRNPTFLQRYRPQSSSDNSSSPGENWEPRTYWDANPPLGPQQQQHPFQNFQQRPSSFLSQQQQQGQLELPRAAGNRRTGIFGGNTQRGGLAFAGGRGVPPQQIPPGAVEGGRPWQGQ